MTQNEIRCESCGTGVPDMDHLVDHITDCHDILDVVVNGVADSYEVAADA